MLLLKLLGDCSVRFQTVRHFFFAQFDPHRNFDGELMAFGTMSGQDMVKWSGKTGQRAKMYPSLKTGYTNDEETQFFRQV